PVDSFAAEGDDAPVDEMARMLSSPPFYGGVAVEGGEVEPRYPEPGVVVSDEEVVEEALPAAREPGGDEVVVEGTPIDPSTTPEDVDALVADARVAIDGRVELALQGRSITFSPQQIGSALKTRVRGTGDDVTLELHISGRSVREIVGDKVDSLETPPVDAGFEVVGGSVTVVPARPGFEFVPKLTATQLLDVALRRGPATARLKGKKESPDFTTRDARSLDIKERVSTFTTYHSCCEPRVENIHRIADIVDGAVVEPGESFSLNDYVGPRTTANGFVAAPSIRDGKFVEEVGGGISQFATTMFNAIFFGGYDFLEYQPHSYYISRYPPGREATISTPAPDLEFLNDSDAGIYIDTAYTDESITVSFYGNQNFDVDAREGPRKNVTPPKTRCREKKSLARGEENVVQEGLTGFDIVVTRVFSDGRPDEHFTTHYDMQPRIVERRRCDKKR
ncbi:MAG: VanW family protein, partial [Actinobacteria bacterium]|nr:VanW family protein [Actinomycetota bacterium]